MAATERLRKSVGNREFATGTPGKTLHVTISCGVASYPLNFDVGGDWHQLVDCADKALYQAKAAGRNCVFGACTESGGVILCRPSAEILAQANVPKEEPEAPARPLAAK